MDLIKLIYFTSHFPCVPSCLSFRSLFKEGLLWVVSVHLKGLGDKRAVYLLGLAEVRRYLARSRETLVRGPTGIERNRSTGACLRTVPQQSTATMSSTLRQLCEICPAKVSRFPLIFNTEIKLHVRQGTIKTSFELYQFSLTFKKGRKCETKE